MRALANCDPHCTQFFVILDRLVTTLDRRFNYWRKVAGENTGMWWGCCFGYCCANRHALNQLWLERLGVARDISRAIEYLHGKKIIYRYVLVYAWALHEPLGQIENRTRSVVSKQRFCKTLYYRLFQGFET